MPLRRVAGGPARRRLKLRHLAGRASRVAECGVYGILLGVPYLLLPVLEGWVETWQASQVPLGLRLLSARVLDNLDLLFPRWSHLVIWPRLAPPTPERPPLPAWGLETTHALAATAFWVVAGLWA